MAGEALEPLRAELNGALGRTWEEWEIPREAGDPWPEDGRDGVEAVAVGPVRRREGKGDWWR